MFRLTRMDAPSGGGDVLFYANSDRGEEKKRIILLEYAWIMFGTFLDNPVRVRIIMLYTR